MVSFTGSHNNDTQAACRCQRALWLGGVADLMLTGTHKREQPILISGIDLQVHDPVASDLNIRNTYDALLVGGADLPWIEEIVQARCRWRWCWCWH